MSQLPKIKLILPPGYPEEDAFELEQAKNRLNFNGSVIMVDGRKVASYEKLVQLATRDEYKNQKYIKVAVVLTSQGPGVY
jgi:hypothetical protein